MEREGALLSSDIKGALSENGDLRRGKHLNSGKTWELQVSPLVNSTNSSQTPIYL